MKKRSFYRSINKTGVFFEEQSAQKIKEAILTFETLSFDSKLIREHSMLFSKERFEAEIKAFVEEKLKQHLENLYRGI